MESTRTKETSKEITLQLSTYGSKYSSATKDKNKLVTKDLGRSNEKPKKQIKEK